MMQFKFNYNNFARVCHSLAACQRHTPSSLAAVIGLSNNDVIPSRSLRCVRCIGWKPRYMIIIIVIVDIVNMATCILPQSRASEMCWSCATTSASSGPTRAKRRFTSISSSTATPTSTRRWPLQSAIRLLLPPRWCLKVCRSIPYVLRIHSCGELKIWRGSHKGLQTTLQKCVSL